MATRGPRRGVITVLRPHGGSEFATQDIGEPPVPAESPDAVPARLQQIA